LTREFDEEFEAIAEKDGVDEGALGGGLQGLGGNGGGGEAATKKVFEFEGLEGFDDLEGVLEIAVLERVGIGNGTGGAPSKSLN
jgi:hypothetical protein